MNRTSRERDLVGALLLFVHILAAGAWLGANFTQSTVTPAMRRTGGAPAAAWMRQTSRISTLVNMPAAITLLITGFWMVIRESAYDFEQVFVAIGIVTVVVSSILGMRVFGPGGKQIADLHETGDESKAAVAYKRLAVWGLLETALVIFRSLDDHKKGSKWVELKLCNRQFEQGLDDGAGSKNSRGD